MFIKSTRGLYYLGTNKIDTPTNEARKHSTQKDNEDTGIIKDK